MKSFREFCKLFLLPIRVRTSTCAGIVVIALIAYTFIFFSDAVDDRGIAFSNFLNNGWSIGDLSAYDMSYQSIFNLLIRDNAPGIRPGPLIPLILALSKSISGSYLLFIAFSLYISFWVAHLSLNILESTVAQVSVKYNLKIRPFLEQGKPFIEIVPFALNPIFMFYVLFPSTDIFFSFIALMIIVSVCRSESFSLCFWFALSVLARPTSLFLIPIVFGSALMSDKVKFRAKYISLGVLFTLSVLGFNYYFGYARFNVDASISLSNAYSFETLGLSSWGFPFPSSILTADFSSPSIVLRLNQIASILFTPFIQLVSLTGLRPSFSTISQVDYGRNLTEQLFLLKPYLYSYIRFLWAMLFSYPGLIIASTLAIVRASYLNFILLACVIVFAIALSPYIVLERYILFAIPYLSSLTACFVVFIVFRSRNDASSVE